MRKTFLERCKSTLKSQKARAKKYGAEIGYTAEDLLAKVTVSCPWCRKKLTPKQLNFDHVVPVSRGGTWTLVNLMAICASCNRRKGALDFVEYHRLIRFLGGMTHELSSDYAEKNILARLAAGGAWIHS